MKYDKEAVLDEIVIVDDFIGWHYSVESLSELLSYKREQFKTFWWKKRFEVSEKTFYHCETLFGIFVKVFKNFE